MNLFFLKKTVVNLVMNNVYPDFNGQTALVCSMDKNNKNCYINVGP